MKAQISVKFLCVNVDIFLSDETVVNREVLLMSTCTCNILFLVEIRRILHVRGYHHLSGAMGVGRV